MLKKSLCLALLLGFSAQALAHNVWLEPAQGQYQYVVKFGHEQTESYPEAKLQQVSYISPQGKLQQVTPTFIEGEGYFSAEQAEIVFLTFDNGVWSKLPNGRYVEKTKQQEPNAVLSLKPIKYGKSILTWSEQAYRAHQQPYELVPLAKPEAGKPLAILVLHQGQPVAQAKLGEIEQAPVATTDQQGIATVPVHSGLNRIWTSFKQDQAKAGEYDYQSVEYLLTFQVD